MVGLRPAELASPEGDPLEIGAEILGLLSQMKLGGQGNARNAALRDEAMERVRQLAWGPARSG